MIFHQQVYHRHMFMLVPCQDQDLHWILSLWFLCIDDWGFKEEWYIVFVIVVALVILPFKNNLFCCGTKGGKPICYGSFIYLDIWFDLSILYLFYIDSAMFEILNNLIIVFSNLYNCNTTRIGFCVLKGIYPKSKHGPHVSNRRPVLHVHWSFTTSAGRLHSAVNIKREICRYM